MITLSQPGMHVLFTHAQSETAYAEWGFNCGPGALCAVLGLTPNALRPYLGDFEQKRFMNPTMMYSALNTLQARHKLTYHSEKPATVPLFPQLGIVRVQWGGRWLRPEVPFAARYHHTHWIAVRGGPGAPEVYDVNFHAWMPFGAWGNFLVPALTEDTKGADGTWYVTHVIQVTP